MKIAGIIAEYNPFHEGHRYHIAETRRRTGADFVVVIMSGHFVQRGEPAIFDPYYRTQCALNAGEADAVFRMPVYYSTASAQEFASYGVRTLAALGCDYVSFGMESRDISEIQKLAEMTTEESGEHSQRIREFMKQGVTYPEAMSKVFGFEKLRPNDILAAEYLKEIKRSQLDIEPVAVERMGCGHDEIAETTEAHASSCNMRSAKAIRQAILSGEMAVPIPPLGPDDFADYLQDLLTMLAGKKCRFEDYKDVSPEIADRLRGMRYYFSSYDELVNAVKTRQYTYSRISRCLMHIMLSIMADSRPEPYAQLLGFRKQSENVLSEIKKRNAGGSLAIITKPADYKELLAGDAYANEIYSRICFQKHGIVLPDIFSRQIVIV